MFEMTYEYWSHHIAVTYYVPTNETSRILNVMKWDEVLIGKSNSTYA